MSDQLTKSALNAHRGFDGDVGQQQVRAWLADCGFEFVELQRFGEVAVGRFGGMIAVRVGRDAERPSGRVMCADIADEVGTRAEVICEAVREDRPLREVVYRSSE